MQANEMRYELLLLLDNLFEFGAPAYDDTQIGSLLTKAQMRVFKKRYDPAFELTEERRRDLEQLIKPAEYDSTDIPGSTITVSSSQDGIHPNGVFFDLPSDFLYAAEEAVTTDTSSGEVKVDPVTHDEYLANIDNPYQNPNVKSGTSVFWRMDISRETQPVGVTSGSAKRTEIITEGGTITKYRMRYISTPQDIVVDSITPANQVHCILDDSIHPEIVDEAYKIAEASVRPEEYQIALNEQRISES
jgi:hypothetical protein